MFNGSENMSNRPWLQLYPKEIPTTLTYDDKPVHAFLKESAEKSPNQVSIHFLGKELTFKEVYESALKFAAYLKELGIEKGDRVAISLPNCPQFVISYFGILLAGGIVVPTNPTYTERELEYQMKDSGSKIIVTMDILFPRATKVTPNTDIQHIIVTAISDYLPFPKNLVYPFMQKKQYGIVVKVEHAGNIHLFKEIMKRQVSSEVTESMVNEHDVALLQYTGGTTGLPKGVMLTNKNLVANTKMCQTWLVKNKEVQEKILGVIPFFHVYGMTTVLLLSIVDIDTMILLPKFDIETTLKTIQKQKPTIFPGAPTIYIGLINHPNIKKYDLSSIMACLSGSAPLPAEVQEQFEEITGGKLVEGYGLSETSPVTHANFIWNGPRVKGSIGVPWPDTDCTILSLDTGEPLFEPNEIGEIAIKGPQVMKGYWNKPEETENTFKNGWLLTGDLGYMDEQGFFYIVERKKDVIIAGGFNIYPREIEEILYEHEAVKEIVIVGIPDSYRGETVKAFVVLKDGHTVTEEELNQFARKSLASYKVPHLYEFRDELPKTTIGKVLRRVLIDEEKSKFSDGRKEA